MGYYNTTMKETRELLKRITKKNYDFVDWAKGRERVRREDEEWEVMNVI